MHMDGFMLVDCANAIGADSDLIAQLTDGALHVVLADAVTVDEARHHFNAIYEEPMAVLVPKSDPLTGQNRITTETLLSRPWISVTGQDV